MIPFELIPLISSHLVLSAGPTLFDIPPSFALDRLAATQHHDHTIPPLPPPPPPDTQVVVPQVRTREAVSEALKAAINTTVQRAPDSNSSTLSLSATVTVALNEKANVAPEPPFAIGNIFLSSCPGKKGPPSFDPPSTLD